MIMEILLTYLFLLTMQGHLLSGPFISLLFVRLVRIRKRGIVNASLQIKDTKWRCNSAGQVATPENIGRCRFRVRIFLRTDKQFEEGYWPETLFVLVTAVFFFRIHFYKHFICPKVFCDISTMWKILNIGVSFFVKMRRNFIFQVNNGASFLIITVIFILHGKMFNLLNILLWK